MANKVLDYYRLAPPKETVASVRAVDTTPFIATGVIISCIETLSGYIWDQASTDADDGGVTTIAPTVGPGRWKRFTAKDDTTIQSPEYGEMYFSDNAAPTVITIANTPVLVNGTYFSGLNANFIFLTDRVIYTGADGIFDASLSLSAGLSLATGTISSFIAINGTVQTKTKSQTAVGPSAPDIRTLSSQSTISLSTGNFIQAFVQNDNATDNITVSQLNLNLSRNTTYAA